MSQRFAQLKLPDPTGRDLHPWLLVDGCAVHAGSRYRALFPDGWHDITLEVNWKSSVRPAGTSRPPVTPTSAPWVCS